MISKNKTTNKILYFRNIDIDFIRKSISFLRSRCHFFSIS